MKMIEKSSFFICHMKKHYFAVQCCTEGLKVQKKILHSHSVASNQHTPLH